jgi:hypothetical protein
MDTLQLIYQPVGGYVAGSWRVCVAAFLAQKTTGKQKKAGMRRVVGQKRRVVALARIMKKASV